MADDGFLHLEHDIFPTPGDGITALGLRDVWDSYFKDGSIGQLIDELLSRANARGSRGVVLTFSGVVVLSAEHLSLAQQSGITSLILYGPEEYCLRAFLEREERTGRRLTAEHWRRNNVDVYPQIGRLEFAPYRLPVFDADGVRLDVLALALDRIGRIA